MEILVALVVIVAAVLFVVWCANAMLGHACPTCYENDGEREIVIPVIPGVRWWCPNCSNSFKTEDLLEQAEIDEFEATHGKPQKKTRTP